MIESSLKSVKVRACMMKIRVRKQDSAYLYQILESYEGLTNYSTVSAAKELLYRDIVLHVTPELRPEVEKLIERLSREIPIDKL